MARESEYNAHAGLASSIRLATFRAEPHTHLTRLYTKRKAAPGIAWSVLLILIAALMFVLGRAT